MSSCVILCYLSVSGVRHPTALHPLCSSTSLSLSLFIPLMTQSHLGRMWRVYFRPFLFSFSLSSSFIPRILPIPRPHTSHFTPHTSHRTPPQIKRGLGRGDGCDRAGQTCYGRDSATSFSPSIPLSPSLSRSRSLLYGYLSITPSLHTATAIRPSHNAIPDRCLVGFKGLFSARLVCLRPVLCESDPPPNREQIVDRSQLFHGVLRSRHASGEGVCVLEEWAQFEGVWGI